MANSIKERFADGLNDHVQKLATEEWFYASLREKLRERLSPTEAFESIDGIADLALEQSDDFLVCTTLWFLLDLVTKSETTKMPPGLSAKWDELVRHAREYGREADMTEVAKWYQRAI